MTLNVYIHTSIHLLSYKLDTTYAAIATIGVTLAITHAAMAFTQISQKLWQTPRNDNCNITDDYIYFAFGNRTCDNMISAITDVVMAINSATAIMFLAIATTFIVLVLKCDGKYG